MRKDPAEEAEMVSQMLFGESYTVRTEQEHWLEIQTQFDHYSGWIDRKLHKEISESFFHQQMEQNQPVLCSLLMSIERHGASPQMILAASTLPGYNRKKDMLVIDDEVFHIRWTFGDFGVKGPETLHKTAGQFLNAPYLWGGRSLFGCDCSGFVQIVFKIHGIKLQRDSSQQAAQGETISSLAHARLGDLAFFANEEGKVYHVGMILSPGEIIHNSGCVHIDRLDETGIMNLENQSYSHKLFSIKRMFL